MKLIPDIKIVLFNERVLEYISTFDATGVLKWNSLMISVTSCVVFLTIRYQSGRKYNIDWEALVHAIVTGTGGSFCVLLDMNIIPQSSYVRCHASTPLHNILPAVTQGYAICDILNGLEFGGAFLAHGIATLMLTSLFSMLGFAYMLSPMLVCEVSTILLSIMRATFFTPLQTKLAELSFFLLFFLCRIVMLPYLTINLLVEMWDEQKERGIICQSKFIWYITFVNILFFNSLNFFWFVKILAKIPRKIRNNK